MKNVAAYSHQQRVENVDVRDVIYYVFYNKSVDLE